MKPIIFFLLVNFSALCYGDSDKKSQASSTTALPLNITSIEKPSRPFEKIDEGIAELNVFIGSYPTRLKNEKHRQQIYQQWLSLISDAESYARINSGNEESLYLLAELYRQGTNLNIDKSAKYADKNIKACLATYPESIACHFSAAYFYLSAGPEYLDISEKSLLTLRRLASPNQDPDVEAGFVFLYMYRQDTSNTQKQIDRFIKLFPNNERVATFQKIKSGFNNANEK